MPLQRSQHEGSHRTVAPSDGIVTVAEVAVVTSELYKSDEPGPVVHNCRTGSTGPAPSFRESIWLADNIPDDGVSAAGIRVQ
jgi:hypothetical protein